MLSMGLKLIFITAAMFAATNAIPTPSLPTSVAPLNCSAVSCLLPVCEEGEKLVVPPGQCCPQCEKTPDCSAVFCLAQACEEGEKAIVPPGQCCPECVPEKIPDCSAVLCLRPVCEEGEILVVSPGQCCPQCVSAAPICSLKPDSGPCEAAIRQFFYNSTTDRCELFIYGGCGGNNNRFNTRSECISTCGADNPCAGVSCQQGSTCKIDDETGEAFCEPSCELDNGGCQSDEICELVTVQCVRAPCPSDVNCRPRSKRSLENNDCPPTCSVEFCSKNPTAQCSNPGPREIPGCTGSCQLTYCHACYSGNEFIPRPEGCPTCQDLRDYLFDSRCFRRWADCVSRKLPDIRPPDDSEEDLKCFNPPCPFKG